MDNQVPNTNNPAPTPAPSAPSSHQNTAMAVIAYILFFVPLLTGDAKKDEFVKFHTKQGLVLFIASLALGIIFGIVPFLWFTLNWLLQLGILVLLIIGVVNAVNGKKEPLPIIGQFAHYFKF